MTRRERMLAALAASLLILVALRSGLGRFQAELDRRESAVDVLREQVSDAELALRRGELAAERLAKWRHRSMPENAELASSLYQAWLSARLRVAGFRDVTINERPSVAMNRSTGLRELSFEVRQAVGDIPALVKFLFAFYESPHLHKISKLTLLPQEKGQQLKLSGMTIDTLVLPGADRDDELAKGKTDRLALAGEREYLRSLADRNVFVAYSPPGQKAKPDDRRAARAVESGSDDEHAYVSGVAQAGSRLQVWIRIRTTGEMHFLAEGDEFEIGQLKGQILSIDPQGQQVVIDTPDGKLVVKPGKNLRQGTPPPTDAGA